MWNKKILTQTIKENLASGNFDAVESACRIAFEKGGLSKSEKRFIKDKFVLIASNYEKSNNIFGAIINVNRARVINPYEIKIINHLINLIRDVIIIYGSDLVGGDVELLNQLIDSVSIIYEPLPQSNFFRPSLNTAKEVRHRLKEVSVNAPNKIEGRITHQLIEILKIFYEDWNEKDIADEWAKNVSKVLKRILKESKSNSSKHSKPIDKSKEAKGDD